MDVAQLNAVELAFLRCRKIGYIFQSYNLVQYMTALENVTVPMAFAGVPPDEARDRAPGVARPRGYSSRTRFRASRGLTIASFLSLKRGFRSGRSNLEAMPKTRSWFSLSSW